jgi:hypothetical protein
MQKAATVLDAIRKRGERIALKEVTTGEPADWKLSRRVREEANGKGPDGYLAVGRLHSKGDGAGSPGEHCAPDYQ